jgi:hypothetical protein
MAWFRRHIGVDYSGVQAPTANLKGLRVFMTEGDRPPAEVLPPPFPRKYWTRRGIAECVARSSANRHRPRLLVSAALFRGARPDARLAHLPRRFPAPLADGQGHLRRFRPRLPAGQRRGAHGRCPMASDDRRARRRREIRLSFRRAGIGGEIHPCRHSLAALHPPAARRARPFLAVRWLEYSGRALGGGRGLSVAMER